MRPAARLAAACALSALSAARAAGAKPSFVELIPHGDTYGCATCHTSTDQDLPSWNAFGEAAKATLDGGVPDWTALASGDPDCDGQTSGEELGDPCGLWRPGQPAARQSGISAPGDPSSTTPTPLAPGCSSAPPAPSCPLPQGSDTVEIGGFGGGGGAGAGGSGAGHEAGAGQGGGGEGAASSGCAAAGPGGGAGWLAVAALAACSRLRRRR